MIECSLEFFSQRDEYGRLQPLLGTAEPATLANLTTGRAVPLMDEYVENAPKDMVTALPDQVTRIKATFDKYGRYVWHCHILSHEDHEMMRVMFVGREG